PQPPATSTISLHDALPISTALTALQYSRQTDYRAFQRAYTKFRHPGNGYTYLGFNLKDPRFADRRVRQAFTYAINKREVIEGVRDRKSTRLNSSHGSISYA